MEFLDCFPESPVTVNLVQEIHELVACFMKSLNCLPGSWSHWMLNLVHEVPELFAWFMKFLNCSPGSWNPLTVSLVHEVPELITWYRKSLNCLPGSWSPWTGLGWRCPSEGPPGPFLWGWEWPPSSPPQGPSATMGCKCKLRVPLQHRVDPSWLTLQCLIHMLCQEINSPPGSVCNTLRVCEKQNAESVHTIIGSVCNNTHFESNRLWQRCTAEGTQSVNFID